MGGWKTSCPLGWLPGRCELLVSGRVAGLTPPTSLSKVHSEFGHFPGTTFWKRRAFLWAGSGMVPSLTNSSSWNMFHFAEMIHFWLTFFLDGLKPPPSYLGLLVFLNKKGWPEWSIYKSGRGIDGRRCQTLKTEPSKLRRTSDLWMMRQIATLFESRLS